MKRIFYSLCALLWAASSLFLTSCRDTGRTLTSATGSIYECLVVASTGSLTQDEIDQIATFHLGQTGGAYDTNITNLQEFIAAVMAEPTPGLPQMEPYFKLTTVTPQAFDDFLKPTRNILLVDINPNKYTQIRVKYLTNQWSTPQAVCRIQAPDRAQVVAWWLENGEAVRSWFVLQELTRAQTYLRTGHNEKARRAVQKTIGADLSIPSDYELIMDTTDFVWCCNNKGPMRKDLVIYRYPYTDANTFTAEYLSQKRDEILSRWVSASVEGSYMGTEYKVFPPIYTPVRSLDPKFQADFFAGELRGLWKIKNGEAMGGPFVSLTRVDELNHNIITAESFIFASGQKKKTALRQSEAILYTLRLPQDVNRLEEVEVQ